MNRLIVSLLLCSTLFFSGCIVKTTNSYVVESTNNKSVIGLAGIEGVTITNISVFNGLSGKSGMIEDKATIEKLVSQLDRYSLEMMEDQMDRGGFHYSLDFYSESDKVAEITTMDDHTVYIDDVYYEVNGTFIDMAEIGELIDPVIYPDVTSSK